MFKNNIRNCALFILIITLFCCHCSDWLTKPETPKKGGNYLPLKKGNTWNYYFPPNDTITYTHTISDEVIIKFKKYYIYSYNDVYADTIRSDSKGRIWKYINKKEHLWFDFTLDNEETYLYNPHYDISGNDYVVTVKKNVTSKYGNKRFENCIDIYFDIPEACDDEVGYVFAPGVGIVHRYGAWVTMFLKSYELK